MFIRTHLTTAQTEYDTLYTTYKSILDSIKSPLFELAGCDSSETSCSTSSDTSSNYIITYLNTFADYILKLKGTFDNYKTKFTDKIYDKRDLIRDKFELVFDITFSLITAFSAAFIVLLILYRICPKCCACLVKILIHILWNLLVLLSVIMLILGGLIGVIGNVGKDIIPVLQYLLSEKNLLTDKIIINNDDGNTIINKCINGDGDLSSLVNMDSDSISNQLSDLSTLLNKASSVISGNSSVSSYSASLSEVTSNQKIIDNYDSNYFTSTFYDNNNNSYDLSSQITEFNKYTSELSNTYQTDTSTCKTDDYYSTSTSYSDYTLYSADNATDAGNSIKSLFYLYNKLPTYTRYSSVTCNVNVKGDTSNVESLSTVAYNYISENGLLYNIQNNFNSSTYSSNFTSANTEMNSNYQTLLSNTKNAISISTTLVSGLVSIFSNFVGNSFMDVVNCYFVGTNLKVLFKVLDEDVGDKFILVGFFIIGIGALQLIGIIFVLAILNLKKEDYSHVNNTDNSIKNEKPINMNDEEH